MSWVYSALLELAKRCFCMNYRGFSVILGMKLVYSNAVIFYLNAMTRQ